MIPIKTIRVELAEGPIDLIEREGRKTHTSWEAAEAHVRALAKHAPSDGSYNKTDVLFTWEDGTEYRIRFDMQRGHARQAAPLAFDLHEMLTLNAGRRCPEHMTMADYRGYLDEVRRLDPKSETEADHLLTDCDIGTPRAPTPLRVVVDVVRDADCFSATARVERARLPATLDIDKTLDDLRVAMYALEGGDSPDAERAVARAFVRITAFTRK